MICVGIKILSYESCDFYPRALVRRHVFRLVLLNFNLFCDFYPRALARRHVFRLVLLYFNLFCKHYNCEPYDTLSSRPQQRYAWRKVP